MGCSLVGRRPSLALREDDRSLTCTSSSTTFNRAVSSQLSDSPNVRLAMSLNSAGGLFIRTDDNKAPYDSGATPRDLRLHTLD